MSGDVQPRKRKDKKRKKEEEPSTTPPVHVFPKEPSEDVNIHIHKEEGTGGGICAKIIFFILFSALIVLIGLIITEHRGLTDLDVAESESKYSQIFEGWVDNDKHDDHHTLDDHDNEHFDDEEHEDDGHTLDDHDDDHMDDEETDEQSEEEHTLDDHDNEHFDDDQSSPPSEENEVDAEYQQEESQSQEEYTEKFRKNGRYRRQVSEEEDDDNMTDSQEERKVDNSKIYINTNVKYDDEEAVDSRDEDIEDRSENLYEDEENSKVQQDNIDDSAEILEDDDNFNDSADENDLNEDRETEDTEIYSKTSDEEIDAEYDSQVDEDDNTITSTSKMVDDVIKNEEYASEEAAYELDNESIEDKDREDTSAEKSAEEPEKLEDNEENKVYMNDKSEGKDQEIYEKTDVPKKSVSDSNESTEENIIQIENKDTEFQDNDHESGNSGGSDNPGSLSNMIIKAVIGAAIMAVGHFVLVKKWKSDSPDETNGGSKEIHIDLTRRNTLIAPPPLQEIQHDVESADKEYNDDEEADDGGAVGSRSVTDVARKKYEQLRSSYSRSISPESDIGHDPKDNESEDELEIEDIEEEELDEEEEEEEEEDVENLHDEDMEDIEGEDIDNEDYENEEYEEDDDEELMKKLEAKYGKLKLEPKTKERTPSTDLDESDSEKLSDDNNEYEFAGITNKDDWQIRKELDEAQLNLRNNAAYALKMFEKVLEKYPSSPRGFYGLAQALDTLADKEKSNELLEEAISNYFKVSEMKNVPDPLYKASLERCIDRTRFRGKYGKAIRVHLKLINRFPDQPEYRNQLTITYLTIGKVEEARSVLEETLQKWPYNGCALVHYGFIWKTIDNNLEKGVFYMQKGIDTQDPCTIDGRFYFHLGDGYSRIGNSKKALKIYQEGVDHKLFLSKYQRSLYNVPRLTARPWWKNNQLSKYNILLEDLEKHWIAIKNEGLAVLNQQGFFQDESENLKDTGDWKQFELFARGRRNTKNCNKTPFTCKLVGSHIDASGCRRGQTKFSVMHPGTHVWSHCGPTNCRLRIHLGLKVPPKTFIRVGDTVRIT
ncbi:hypothetical protein WA026_008856 [Henosepilachna vigintioctopunctata]|uniref:Aspartyl/asparaginy/proline hydroxylase domain-containing protein n=1 Tax=Henosepilachna vigintioctopunctata TaxID=420089 RepID=A0AAW1VBF1_9CUCU